MEKLTLELSGMGCVGCVKNVQKTLAALPGVTAEKVEVGWAVVAYDPAKSSAEAILSALGNAGYPASRQAGTAAAADK